MVFKAHFLPVGCADCTIFEMDNHLVMIDCGYRRSGNGVSKPTDIFKYLKNTIGKTYIDLLIISHPHHDHFLGLEDFIGKVTIAEYWGSPYERRYGDSSLSLDEWNEYNNLKGRLVPNVNNRYICYKDEKKTFSNCIFTVLGPRNDLNKRDTRECHDGCLVIWVSTPANNFIICGDASDSELDEIRDDWKISGCHVLRASHHGSINGANIEFIKAASPRDTIISTESGIFDNIPSATAFQRYKSYSTKVFRTDVDGLLTASLKV